MSKASVYYSSRGPRWGLWNGNNSLISPLAVLLILTHKHQQEAFSGTSSAAPALAGISAVLMSAIKQEGLTLNIDAVVAAIKMSGKITREHTLYFSRLRVTSN